MKKSYIRFTPKKIRANNLILNELIVAHVQENACGH
jgi:hypothetical protein